MPQILKGKTKFTIPAEAKPGDVIDIDANFEADQADYERALRDRLAQKDRVHEKALEDLRKELEAKPATPDEKTAQQLAALAAESKALKDKLAAAELKERINKQLEKAGLDKVPAAFRATINLPADASDDDIKAAVEGLAADPDVQTFTKVKEEPSAGGERKAPEGSGRRGQGGSRDTKAKLDDLKEKARLNAPNLFAMLDPNLDEAAQQDVLQTWENQGHLKSPSDK